AELLPVSSASFWSTFLGTQQPAALFLYDGSAISTEQEVELQAIMEAVTAEVEGHGVLVGVADLSNRKLMKKIGSPPPPEPYLQLYVGASTPNPYGGAPSRESITPQQVMGKEARAISRSILRAIPNRVKRVETQTQFAEALKAVESSHVLVAFTER
ncbi:unnamed protein product, partial [Chrysoparadoxa australica]